MKITESQLRNIVREQIRVTLRHQTMNEGFFGDLIDKVTGKTSLADKLKVLKTGIEKIAKNSSNWAIDQEAELILKRIDQSLKNNDKSGMQLVLSRAEKSLLKIKKMSKEALGAEDTAYDQAREKKQKKSSIIAGVNIEQIPENLSGHVEDMQRLRHAESKIKDNDRTAENAFDDVVTSFKFFKSIAENSSEMAKSARNKFDKKHADKVVHSINNMATLKKIMKSVVSIVKNSSWAKKQANSSYRKQLEKMSEYLYN